MSSTDALGVEIKAGDKVRVIYRGGRITTDYVGRTWRVLDFTRQGSIIPEARGAEGVRALDTANLPADYVAVCRRDGQPGLEGNRTTTV